MTIVLALEIIEKPEEKSMEKILFYHFNAWLKKMKG